MRMLLILIVGITILSTMDIEPDLASEYTLSPFERCEQAYKGNEQLIKQCEALK